jgi:hypothetical protein
MANLQEAFYLSVLIVVAAGIRIAIGRRYTDKVGLVLFLGLCIGSVTIYFVTPSLPE